MPRRSAFACSSRVEAVRASNMECRSTKKKDGDSELVSEGVPLLIDATSLAYLDGSTIDFDDGLHGKGFEIKNPNAQSTCGCGKSFS